MKEGSVRHKMSIIYSRLRFLFVTSLLVVSCSAVVFEYHTIQSIRSHSDFIEGTCRWVFISLRASSVQHQDLFNESECGLTDRIVGRQFGLSDRKLHKIPAKTKTVSCFSGAPTHM